VEEAGRPVVEEACFQAISNQNNVSRTTSGRLAGEAEVKK
jgi:hypothetical protein